MADIEHIVLAQLETLGHQVFQEIVPDGIVHPNDPCIILRYQGRADPVLVLDGSISGRTKTRRVRLQVDVYSQSTATIVNSIGAIEDKMAELDVNGLRLVNSFYLHEPDRSEFRRVIQYDIWFQDS